MAAISGITKTELFKFLQQEGTAYFGAIWQLAFKSYRYEKCGGQVMRSVPRAW